MVDRMRKRWAELTPARKHPIGAAAAVQLGLRAVMLWDFRRRARRPDGVGALVDVCGPGLPTWSIPGSRSGRCPHRP